MRWTKGTDLQKLRTAWIAFLGHWDWQVFATLTFREDVHPAAAGRCFHRFLNKINRTVYGPRWYKKHRGIPWVRVEELQQRRVLHFHALFIGLPPSRPLTLWEAEWGRLAGYARIQPIRCHAAVYRYITKPLGKGGDIELADALQDAMQAPR
jgi:hypothetical protein